MIYWLSRSVLRPIFKMLFGLSVEGLENLPASGPVVLAANHISYLDPLVVGLASPRRTAFVAKEELFKIPIFGWYIRKLEAFPVRRGAPDRRAFKAALDKLTAGQIVGIFPQGARQAGIPTEGFPGAAVMAYKTGAVILPTAIRGTDKVMPPGSRRPRFPRIKVIFGKPIKLDGGDRKLVVAEATERIVKEIQTLMGT
jgi:1-acyl-sn-glycerol-3-phosphate acyltransferase